MARRGRQDRSPLNAGEAILATLSGSPESSSFQSRPFFSPGRLQFLRVGYKMRWPVVVLTCVAYGFASGISALAQTADIIYHNGSILTMAGSTPSYVESLAVRNGKIAFVGSVQESLELRGETTRLVDLDGKTMLPGFLDAHSHYINSLLVANQCPLYAPPSGPGKDVPSILAELKAYATARKIPKGQLITAYGYDDTVMPAGRLLNRDDLDEAFPDNPVRVDHVSMHGTVMNSWAGSRLPWTVRLRAAPLPSRPLIRQVALAVKRFGTVS